MFVTCDNSLLGAIIIVMGLYSVVWGKSKDHLLTLEKDVGQELPTANKRTLDPHPLQASVDTMDEPFKIVKIDTRIPQDP